MAALLYSQTRSPEPFLHTLMRAMETTTAPEHKVAATQAPP